MQVERTEFSLLDEVSGERVSNTWATCPLAGDNIPKGVLIPNELHLLHGRCKKGGLLTKLPLKDGPASD